MTYDSKACFDAREFRSSADDPPPLNDGGGFAGHASVCGMSIAIDYLRRHMGAVPQLRQANDGRGLNGVNVVRMRP